MSSSTSTSSETSRPAVQEGRTRLRGVMLFSVIAALMLTQLLEALDQTVVGTALPKIIGSLQGFDRYAWVVTAYLLAATTVVPIVGKLSDQFGRKWFFVVGVVIFLVGSFLAGIAQTMNQLILFRAMQGLGSGVGIALVFTVIGDIFPPAERVWWQGIFGAVYGFSSVVGPTVGGWLSDHGPLVGSIITDQTRWRWVFYVNLPLGLIALVALLVCLPDNLHPRISRYSSWGAVRRIDFPGAILAAAATICLLLGLTWWSQQNYSPGSPQVVGALVGAFLLFVAFFFVERVATEPILPLGLFRNQVFAADAVITLASGMVLFGLTIYMPLFLQGALGASATGSGALMTPLTFSLVIGAAISGIIVAKTGRYQLITILGAGMLLVGVFLLARMTTSTGLFQTGINMVIAGIGVGTFFSVLTLVAQNALPHRQIGVGTSTVTYLRAIGQTLGTAVVGAIVNSTISADIVTRLSLENKQTLPAGTIQAASDPQVLTNPAYQGMITHNAVNSAVKQAIQKATAKIPAGPHHDQQVASTTQQIATQVTQHTTIMLDQVYGALKQSLATGLTQAFSALLVLCLFILVASLFLKDVPLAKEFLPDPEEIEFTESAEGRA